MILAFNLHVGFGDVQESFPNLTRFISIYEGIHKKEYNSWKENMEENLSGEDFIGNHDYEMRGEIN